MMWTEEQWATFVAILSRGFAAREPFTTADADVYRMMLDGVEPEQALGALRHLVAEGQTMRPKPGEIVSRARRDASVPTFDEAYRLIFDHPRGLLSSSEKDAKRLKVSRAQAIAEREDVHPLVRAFVQRKGVDFLGLLPVDDPDYGLLRRAELQRDWDAHVAALEGRDVAALAAPRGERGLHSFDPLAALGQPTKQIGDGS